MKGQRHFDSTTLLLAVIILLQLLWYPIWPLDPDKDVDQYLVDQWKMADGLPSNEIRSIAQTPDGYLWIATPKGLVRFDGMKFLTISFADKERMDPLKTIIPDTLFVDRDGFLWIGSTGVLTSYNYKTGRFKSYTSADGLTGDRIRRIKSDMKGNLWISFWSSYINRFSNGKFTVFNTCNGLTGKKINAIIEDQKGNLLFGSRENGVFIYKNGQFFEYSIENLGDSQIITMHEDWKGDLWIGTDNGLLRITGKSTTRYTAASGLSNNYVTDIKEDSEHNLWIGTVKGLNRIKKKKEGRKKYMGGHR
jgi:ligand-binding sensor domain-containing protein